MAKIFNSLYSKLSIVLTGLFCLVGVIFVVITLFSTEMYQQEVNQKLNSKIAEHIVQEKLLMRDNRINKKALKEVDQGNVIQMFSSDPGSVKDMEAFCNQTGHSLLSSEQQSGDYVYMVRKN